MASFAHAPESAYPAPHSRIAVATARTIDLPIISYASPKIYTINAPITPLVPEQKGGAVEPNGYSIDKPLPAGLMLNPNTGVISGTPTALSPATVYTITARNAAGPSQATLNIKISDEVLFIAAPPVISYATPQTLYLKTPAAPILPENKGGDVLRYSNGLLLNFAGTGHPGRNNGQKDATEFDTPIKVAIDASGNFFVTDFNNYALRKMMPDGHFITTTGFAGPGYANGAYGTSQLQGPRGVVTDKAGNAYVADTYSIRKVTSAGITSTLAGSSVPGNVDGNGTTARFDGVFSLTMDSQDNIYAVDQGNRLIRKVTLAGAVTTIAGNSNRAAADGQGTLASFVNPQDIVFTNGNFLIADYLTLRKMTPGGLVSTVAGNGQRTVANGPALSGSFGSASAVGVNAAGDIYILDLGNNAANEGNAILRRIDKDNNLFTVSLMDATGTKTYMEVPYSLTFDKEGLIYVASGSNYIQTISFDRYTIDRALPVGLTFDTGTGQISGTPTALSPETPYTITAYNSGGKSTTILKLKVVPNENKIPNIITFPDFASPAVWDEHDHNLDPQVTSQQTETPLVLTSSNPAVATINADNTLHILSAGETIVTASQAGNDSYLPAASVQHTLRITKIGPTMQFPSIAEKTLCDADFSVAGTSTNTATPIIYTSTKPEVASVDQSGVVHIVGPGSTYIRAVQSGTPLYYDSQTVSRVLTVNAYDTQIPAPTVSITTPTTKIYEHAIVQFTASTSGTPLSYQWHVNGIDVGTNSLTFSTADLHNQDNVNCTVTFTQRCVSPVTSNTITMQVSMAPLSIVPPNTFTPNGDGINDTWKIPALASYPNCTVRVFNRNGTEIILSRGYSKVWDGTFGGKLLPAGVYYYVIDPGDGQIALSGNVTILR